MGLFKDVIIDKKERRGQVIKDLIRQLTMDSGVVQNMYDDAVKYAKSMVWSHAYLPWRYGLPLFLVNLLKRKYRYVYLGPKQYMSVIGKERKSMNLRLFPMRLHRDSIVFFGPGEVIKVDWGFHHDESIILRYCPLVTDMDRLIAEATLEAEEEILRNTQQTAKFAIYVRTGTLGAGGVGSGPVPSRGGLSDHKTVAPRSRRDREIIWEPSESGVFPNMLQLSVQAQVPIMMNEGLISDLEPYCETLKSISDNAFAGRFYTDEELGLVDRLKKWYSSEKWYKDRGLPWKRGVLLYGPGGTGKSSLAASIGLYLNLPIYMMRLSTFTDQDLINEWTSFKNQDCIILIEDIDEVFHLRENVTGKAGSVSFGCLLNLINGVESGNAANLLIITTNKPESIDPALGRPREGGTISTRPGRIDETLFMGPMHHKERRLLVQSLLRAWPQEWDRIVEETDGMVASQVRETCVQKMFSFMESDDHVHEPSL